MPAVARAEAVRDAAYPAGREIDVARADRHAPRLDAVARALRRRPELERRRRPRARRRSPPRRSGSAAARPRSPGGAAPVRARVQLGAGGARERPPPAAVASPLDVVDVHDARRPLAELRQLRLARGGLALPGMVAAARVDPAAAEPRDAGARQVAQPRSGARVPKASTSRPVVARAQRVRLAQRGARCSRPAPHLERRAVLRRQTPEPASTKKISSSAVCRWNGVDHLPGSIADPVDADRLRAGRHAEVGPVAGDMAGFRAGRSRPRPSGRSHADYVPSKRRAERSTTSSAVACRRRPLARPLLGLAEQAAQLGQQLAGRRAAPVERVDPVEPGETREPRPCRRR